MTRFIVRRLFSMALVLIAISILTFGIFNVIPDSDPAVRLAGRTATPQNIASVRRSFGLDKPIYTQYFRTMKQIFTGTIISYQNQLNVVDQIKQDIPATISLALGAGIIWLFFGIVLGLLSAITAGKLLDRAITVFALIGISTPVFLIGALMIYVFAFKLNNFLPAGGYVPLTQDPIQWFVHLILPWAALAVLFIGFYARVLRSNILDTINEDYVRTARAKGLSERSVLIKHVLRNSLIPIISLWGLDFAAVIGGGAILTETVFNLQGVGFYAFQSIGNLDVPPVLVIVMFGAFFVVLLSAIVDILYATLDPRIRLAA